MAHRRRKAESARNLGLSGKQKQYFQSGLSIQPEVRGTAGIPCANAPRPLMAVDSPEAIETKRAESRNALTRLRAEIDELRKAMIS